MPAPQDIHSCSYMCARMECVKAQRDELRQRVEELERDAARYRRLRRGQHWSVVNGIGDILRADELDAVIDAAMEGK